MHGARNDFVILDRRVADVPDVSAFARRVCDRNTGIGADGVLLIETSERADVRMRVINADGGEAEMCGNGIRCVARYLEEEGEGERFQIETLAGTIEADVISHDPNYVVRVDMGVPKPESRAFSIPDAHFVDMGNPHVVLMRGQLDDLNLELLGERFQHDSRFPNGTNVHIAVIEDPHSIRVRHYERGVGLTMACGTGAVASAVTAIGTNRVHSPVAVHVPGGNLTVEWDGVGTSYLSGPAERVFETAVDVEGGNGR
jgi:diaminopimelate epimerase